MQEPQRAGGTAQASVRRACSGHTFEFEEFTNAAARWVVEALRPVRGPGQALGPHGAGAQLALAAVLVYRQIRTHTHTYVTNETAL